MEVRINKGVKPYGGRRMPLIRLHTYPNGRIAVIVPAPGGRSWFSDDREYRLDEVTPLDDEARKALADAREERLQFDFVPIDDDPIWEMNDSHPLPITVGDLRHLRGRSTR